MKQFLFVRRAALSAAVLGLVAGAAQAQTKVKTKSSSAGKQKTVMPATPAKGGQTGTGLLHPISRRR